MMPTLTFIDSLRSAARSATAAGTRHVVLCRLDGLVAELAALSENESVRPALREKASAFLGHIETSWISLGDRLFHAAFTLNVVGEAMVRSRLLNQHVIEFVHVGLYFFGQEQIERRWPHRSEAYSEVHGEHLQDFVGRPALKQLLSDGAAKLEEGRVFCLTYAYLNGLRQAYWSRCRTNSDVLDVALSADALDAHGAGTSSFAAPEPTKTPDSMDRVALMLDIFGRSLSPRQRWIYLAKNRASMLVENGSSEHGESQVLAEDLGELLARALGEARPSDDMGWTEIASQLELNEKTAKREYLRAMEILLRDSSAAVFGDRVPSAFVRRILSQIRAVVQEKDLRIKSATGRGLGTLIDKWEVALRFVLNHERVPA